METKFTRLFTLEAPIMQAPIGTAAGPELAAAVSNAGGLGTLVIWTMSPADAASAIAETQQRTHRPFAVNIRADLNLHEHVAIALERGVAAVHLFWGDPTPYIPAIHRGGAKAIVTVSDEDDAKRAIDAGADVLLAQGWEAGGHVRGVTGTFALVPAIVDMAGGIPVIAAGGVVDGRSLAAVLMLGADGVAMGTRFVACAESRAHPDYKDRVVAARHLDTVSTTVFDLGWPDAPHRTLNNSTFRQWEAAGYPASGLRPNEHQVVAQAPDGRDIVRYSAAMPTVGYSGDIETLALYAGQGVGAVREVSPAAAIIHRIAREANGLLASKGSVSSYEPVFND